MRRIIGIFIVIMVFGGCSVLEKKIQVLETYVGQKNIQTPINIRKTYSEKGELLTEEYWSGKYTSLKYTIDNMGKGTWKIKEKGIFEKENELTELEVIEIKTMIMLKINNYDEVVALLKEVRSYNYKNEYILDELILADFVRERNFAMLDKLFSFSEDRFNLYNILKYMIHKNYSDFDIEEVALSILKKSTSLKYLYGESKNKILYLAIKSKNIQLIDLILKLDPRNLSKEFDESLILEAIKTENENVVNMILNSNIDIGINKRDAYNTLPLAVAIKGLKYELIEKMLEKGADYQLLEKDDFSKSEFLSIKTQLIVDLKETKNKDMFAVFLKTLLLNDVNKNDLNLNNELFEYLEKQKRGDFIEIFKITKKYLFGREAEIGKIIPENKFKAYYFEKNQLVYEEYTNKIDINCLSAGQKGIRGDEYDSYFIGKFEFQNNITKSISIVSRGCNTVITIDEKVYPVKNEIETININFTQGKHIIEIESRAGYGVSDLYIEFKDGPKIIEKKQSLEEIKTYIDSMIFS